VKYLVGLTLPDNSKFLRLIGFLFVIIIVYLLIERTMAPLWPYDQTIVYPLYLLYQYSVLPLACFTLIVFAVIGFRVFMSDVVADQWIAILIGLVGTILFCALNFGFGIVQAIIFLVLIGIIVARKERALGINLVLAIICLVLVLIPLFHSLFYWLEHRESVVLNGRIYNLTLLTDGDMDCTDHSFRVYQCDSSGIICHPVYRSDNYGICLGQVYRKAPSQSHLIANPAANTLQLRLDDELIDIPLDS
jgi:hypothetical protein